MSEHTHLILFIGYFIVGLISAILYRLFLIKRQIPLGAYFILILFWPLTLFITMMSVEI